MTLIEIERKSRIAPTHNMKRAWLPCAQYWGRIATALVEQRGKETESKRNNNNKQKQHGKT